MHVKAVMTALPTPIMHSQSGSPVLRHLLPTSQPYSTGFSSWWVTKRKRKCKQCPLFVNDMPWLWCAGLLACRMSANRLAIWSQRFWDGTVGFRPLMREIAIFWMISPAQYAYIPLIKHFSLLSMHRWREVSPKLGLTIVLPSGRMDWSMRCKRFRERSSIQEFLLKETSLLTVDFCIPKSQKCSVLFTISKSSKMTKMSRFLRHYDPSFNWHILTGQSRNCVMGASQSQEKTSLHFSMHQVLTTKTICLLDVFEGLS